MAWSENAKHCSSRLIPSDWMQDTLQRNALRVESTSVSMCADRCTLQPPEHWKQAAKDRSALWCYSGGSPLVFGECNSRNCPMKEVWEKQESVKA